MKRDRFPGLRAFVPWLALTTILVAPAAARAQAAPFAIDHFTWYDALGPAPLVAPSISDQFLTFPSVDLGPVVALMPPAQKLFLSGTEPLLNPLDHLVCYQVPPVAFSEQILVDNQFGLDQPLTVSATRMFCVPSFKDDDQVVPHTVDHYLCYDAVGPMPPGPFPPVVIDQFQELQGVEFGPPEMFCNPAQKNAEPVLHPLDHLTCYPMVSLPPEIAPGERIVFNQFGTALVNIHPNRGLCVPSLKTVVVPTTTTTTTTSTTSTTMGLPLCGPAPAAGCKTGAIGKSRLKMKLAGGVKDQFLWKLGKGVATTAAEFLAPDTQLTTTLRVCVYDASGTAQPLAEMDLPPDGTCAGKPCWKSLAAKGYLYKDKELTPDGLLKTKLRAGVAGKSSVFAKGKGVNLPMPSLPLAFPATVQLLVTDGVVTNCWQTVFPTFKVNDTVRVNATGP